MYFAFLRRIGITTIDRYIFRKFIFPFIGALILFVGISLLGMLINEINFYIRMSKPAALVARLYYYRVPYRVVLTIPVAYLFATLYTVGSMVRDNEYIAVVGAGISYFRMLRIIYIAGFIGSLLIVLFTEVVVTDAEYNADRLSDRIRGSRRIKSKSQRDVSVNGLENRAFIFDFYDAYNKKMRGNIIVYKRNNISFDTNDNKFDAMLKKIRFDKANLSAKDFRFTSFMPISFLLRARESIYDKKRGEWKFVDYSMIKWQTNNLILIQNGKEGYFGFKEPPFYFERQNRRERTMKIAQIKRYIEKYKNQRKIDSYNKVMVEYHLKFAFAFMSFVIVVFSIPLGTVSKKHVLVISFAISIIIYFLYYMVLMIGIAFGRAGNMHPILGAWLGDIVFLIIGIVMHKFVKT